MNAHAIARAQRGVVLVVSMLFLLVVTIISVIAARNSTFTTKMSANLQDAYSSFQSAEAGVFATMLLARTPNDPFQREDILAADNRSPFDDVSADAHPLRELNDDLADEAVGVEILFTGAALTCPRSREASSINQFVCDYYRVESEHDVDQRARTKVNMGVVKTLIGAAP
jgi:type IV pilus assembly protein PilX